MEKIYAIRDRIAKDWIGNQMYKLMTFKTDEQAVRYFADSILDERSILNKHPADYDLLCLGQLDEEHGILPLQPTVIITGDALIAATQPQIVKEA